MRNAVYLTRCLVPGNTDELHFAALVEKKPLHDIVASRSFFRGPLNGPAYHLVFQGVGRVGYSGSPVVSAANGTLAGIHIAGGYDRAGDRGGRLAADKEVTTIPGSQLRAALLGGADFHVGAGAQR